MSEVEKVGEVVEEVVDFEATPYDEFEEAPAEAEQEVKEESPAEGEKAIVPDDRPEKNWKAELDRKISQAVSAKDAVIEELKKEMASIKEGQTEKQLENERKQLEDKFLDLGYDKEVVALIDKQMKKEIEKARQEMKAEFSQEISAFKQQSYATAKDRNLNLIKAEDKTGLVEKHYAEVQEVISQLDPKLWDDKDAMKKAVGMVLGSIIMDNPIEIKEKKKASAPTNDNPTPSNSKVSGLARKSTINRYKEEFNIDDSQAVGVAKASDDLDKVMFGK